MFNLIKSFMQIGYKYADLLDDDVFKLVFGQESSKDVMIEFLNQVITDRNIVDLEFRDKEMHPLARQGKSSIYDMFCQTDDGSRIIVEVQRRKQPFYSERAIYYSTFQIQRQVDAGADYYGFLPVYVINILEFELDETVDNPEVKTTYRLYEENSHSLLTDKLTFVFIELGKFRKSKEELDGNILEGMYFCLKNMAALKARPEALEHNVFKKIFEMSELLNMDEVTRSKVIDKMTTERDLRNQMAYARQIAIEEGLAEGRAKGLAEGRAEGRAKGLAEGLAEGRVEGEMKAKQEHAAKLKQLGVSVDIICEATGLSMEAIESL